MESLRTWVYVSSNLSYAWQWIVISLFETNQFFRLASPFRGSVCIFRICPLVFFEAPSLAYLNRTQNQRLRLLGSGSVNKW